MDNASNCDVATSELARLLPEFRGMASGSWCFAHVVNLVAKVQCYLRSVTSANTRFDYQCLTALDRATEATERSIGL